MSVLTMEIMEEMLRKALQPVRFVGPKIIEDKYLYKIHFKVRGVPAAHKPNKNRPYYRKVRTVEYPIYYMKAQNAIICHPIMANKIREGASRK